MINANNQKNLAEKRSLMKAQIVKKEADAYDQGTRQEADFEV